MFGSLGMSELIIILVIALIIFGPRKLPELGRSLGRTMVEFKKATSDIQATVEDEIRRESEAKSAPPADPKPAASAAATTVPEPNEPTTKIG